MTTKRLTPRQRDYLNMLVEVTASNDVARFTMHSRPGYSQVEIRRVDSRGFDEACAWMPESVFAALCVKGALDQINHPTRSGVCLGYVVAPKWRIVKA